MTRKTKVIGFSLPPEIEQKLQEYAEKNHKTRSELMREMIESYLGGSKAKSAAPLSPSSDLPAHLINVFQQQRMLKKPLVIICSLIIRHPTRRLVLICKRTVTDETAPNLSWCFPGAKLDSFDIDLAITKIAKVRTGIGITPGNLIAARRNPDVDKSAPFTAVSIYIEVKATNTRPVLDSQTYSSYKWVDPMKVFSYFTTSVCSEVTEYLSDL